MKRDHWLLLVAAGGGALIWAVIVAVTGKREAWDSSLYFSVGVPAVCVLAATLGFVEPRKVWRWGVAPLAGQFVCMLLMVGPGSLLPLGLIVFGVLSIPPAIAAWLGAVIARRAQRDRAS